MSSLVMAARQAPDRGIGISERLLRVPLFYKILIANSGIVLVGTLIATQLDRTFLPEGGAPIPWMAALALVGVVITVLVNAVILRLALQPLKLLEETAARVQRGDLDARVPYSPLRDVQLERLTRTFNGMLDTLESYSHRLGGLAERALSAQEQERKRIARELHDDTAQSLAALLVRLRLLRGVDDPQAHNVAVEEFREEIGEALERIRRFARGLRPPALDELGLVPALESHARALSESVGVNIRVDAGNIDETLSRDAELALYRIAQEAISNAVRHAEPKQVVVRIEREGDAVALTVSDDGRGFEAQELDSRKEQGLGFFGMKERASYFGGYVTIESRRGSGTRVRALIPTDSHAKHLRWQRAGETQN